MRCKKRNLEPFTGVDRYSYEDCQSRGSGGAEKLWPSASFSLKAKCPELKASEPKSDLALDACAPGVLFENGKGRGVAFSNTATLAKIRNDIEEAQKHFIDLKILFFVTPKPVSERKAES
jgi:hypothetical protein